jgi:hypothetical protein
MEVDPDRDLDEDEAPIDEVDIRLNQYELLLRASKLLKSILKSPTELPPFVFSWAFASEIKASPHNYHSNVVNSEYLRNTSRRASHQSFRQRTRITRLSVTFCSCASSVHLSWPLKCMGCSMVRIFDIYITIH